MFKNHQNEKPIEILKKVTKAASRALSHKTTTADTLKQNQQEIDESKLDIPISSHHFQKKNISPLRGEADSKSLWFRFHNQEIHYKFEFEDSYKQQLFDQLELIRCDMKGAKKFPGVAYNLQAAIEERCQMKGYYRAQKNDKQWLADVIALSFYKELLNFELPNTTQVFLDQWKEWIDKNLRPIMPEIDTCIDQQEDFGNVIYQFLDKLDLDQESEKNKSKSNKNKKQRDQKENQKNQQCQKTLRKAQNKASKQNVTQKADQTLKNAFKKSQKKELSQSSKTKEDQAFYPENQDTSDQAHSYHIFTTQFDQVIEAQKICDSEELTKLRKVLDQQLIQTQIIVTKLANRLQRQLMAWQTRSWEFDQEEGLVDTGKLARIIANPTHALSYKKEKNILFKDTVVSILIDNSGSMRGRPIMTASMSADILARTLERCGVKVEILGFTTKAWKGGEAREKWVQDGKPRNPGRLNDLRHIIYKSADMPWRRTRKGLGLMLKEGLLKENIDGEALHWAYSRLMARSEMRRILMIISDGAPVDDSTLSVNPGNYLEKHLKEVIYTIEKQSPVELVAIGIGHDVTRYYKKAVTIADPDELGTVMVEKLSELFNIKKL